MKINESTHLCYSLNIFSNSSDGYLQNVENISGNFCGIRTHLGLCDETPVALGLWLNADAVEELSSSAKLAELKSMLQRQNFYVFTVNAFPYGKFHDGLIKDNVYLPDWTSELRRDFTCGVADILAELLPDGVTGSISTLPGGYKEHLERRTSNYEEEIAGNLIFTADHLASIEKTSGKKIILGIEMEPDCIWETPREFCEFRTKYLESDNALRYIGVCYDTCHQELLEGAPGSGLKFLQSQNVPIAKIQLSAALEGNVNEKREGLLEELANFADPVYLHQTRFFDKENKIISSFKDIPDVEQIRQVCSRQTEPARSEFFKQVKFVVHFHMPLYASEVSDNLSVAKGELEAVIAILKNNPDLCTNLEIETYTYKVLPDSLKAESVEQMIIDEYRWVLSMIN